MEKSDFPWYRLDKGKSILSDQRTKNWELHNGAEDGYLEIGMDT